MHGIDDFSRRLTGYFRVRRQPDAAAQVEWERRIAAFKAGRLALPNLFTGIPLRKR